MDLIKSNFIELINLTEEDFTDISEKLIKRNYSKGEKFLRSGNENRSFYFIKKGILKVVANQGSKNFIIEFLKPGESFGKTSYFGDGLMYTDVCCITDCEIYQLREEDVKYFLDTVPVFAANILKSCAKHLRKHEGSISNLVFNTVKERVIIKLLYLVNIFRGKTEDTTFIDLPLIQSEFADFVGSARENVSRVLTELKNAGIIDIRTKKIIIRDEDALRKIRNEIMS